MESERYRNGEITLSAERGFKDDDLIWEITAKHIYTGVEISVIDFSQIGGAREAVKLLDEKLDLLNEK